MQPAGRAVITRTSYSDDGDGEGQEKDPKKPDSHNGAKETMGSTPPWGPDGMHLKVLMALAKVIPRLFSIIFERPTTSWAVSVRVQPAGHGQ
ncbi:hypothetical protein GRJ2_002532200 [Grus japonensis]|uniref:Uncharacterized protein n=1 Tax=Grus japonensis TaxID=30415 RepID=A0ABC9XVX5_GRUJA